MNARVVSPSQGQSAEDLVEEPQLVADERPTVAIIGTRGYPSYYGGFETAVRYLSPYLARKGWRVRVYSRKGQISVDDPTRDSRVETVYTRGFKWRALDTVSHGLTSSLHAIVHRPDVALVMNVANGFWIPLLRMCGIPVMTNVDGIEWIRGKWGALARWTFLNGARLTRRWSNLLVFDAQAIRRWWSDEFGSTGVVIEYGALPPAAKDRPTGVDLVPGEYVLYVARLVPENSVMEFLEAAKVLARGGTRVVIVGSDGVHGALDDAVRELASKHENVEWLGRIEDDRLLFWLWSNAGVYFHGHSVGGTNPALVQAMWCEACVVARDTVFNREVLGDAGVFVEPDPELIAKTIGDVLRAPERRLHMGRQALKRARSHYSLARINGLYDSELRKLSGLPLQGRVDTE